MLFRKTHLLVVFITMSYSFYGQVYDLTLTKKDKDNIIQKVLSEKKSGTVADFVDKATKANISAIEIDALLHAKETYIYLQKRIKTNSKLKDALFLFSEDRGKLKRENFSTYRKKLATILSQKQFYALYKELLDQKTMLALQYKMDELAKKHELNNASKKELQALIEPLCKDICLAEAYYAYDKKLVQNEKYRLEEVLAATIKEKVNLLGYKESHIFDSSDPKMIDFIETAKSIQLDDKLIVEIADKIETLNKQIGALESSNKGKESAYLYTLYDTKLNSSDIYRDFEGYITSVLNQDQYQLLFWEQLKPEIDQIAHQKFIELEKSYDLTKLKTKERKSLKNLIYKFTTEQFVTSRYHTNDSPLTAVKVKLIKDKANKSYKKIIHKKNNLPIIEADVAERAKEFLDNALEQGITPEKANRILEACLAYELKQEELMVRKKYQKTAVYTLSKDNSKTELRNSFRYFLTQNLTKEEYRKIFWLQLAPEINKNVKRRIAKIRETYPQLKEGELFDEIRKMLKQQVTNETVAKYYYSYDKKIAKQKVKALQYKFNTEYKEKVKQIL